MMRKPITHKSILYQLKADLIGKDSYRGITLTYAWLANQFGHFSLGFIPTLICYSVLKRWSSSQYTAFLAALIITILWLLFELYNFLGPLLLKNQSKSKVLFIPSKEKYIFNPEWRNIAFDTFTDLCFFGFGAFGASLFLDFLWINIYVLIILLFILIYPCSYWYIVKMYLQYAKYPFQFRLSQWNYDISDIDKKTIYNFLKNKSSGEHLFVFGGRRSGKTSLSVGIATELSIRQETCIYTTAMKLYSMFSESELLSDKESLWTWQDASLMIIDDINPGDPINDDIVTPNQFLKMLDTYSANRDTIKNKNIIWVMGNENRIKELFINWSDMLKNIGVNPKKNIHSINLHFKSFL